jgi:hypothetical protein
MNIKRGIYFLSNNNMLDFTIAFLYSLRCHNPDIPLCLIPYNSDYKEIEALEKEFNFITFKNEEILNECDKIAELFSSSIPGTFRKLAIWEGPFDEFIYIDIDTVVLSNLYFVFYYLSEYDFITSHAFVPFIRHWVWKDSIYDANILNEDQINYAANTGFIVSHKNALPLTSVLKKIPDAQKLKSHMEVLSGEQPLLNYLIVTSGKYTSLLSLYINFYHRVPLEQWAGKKYGVVFRGKIFFPFSKHPTLLLHWAGIYRFSNFENWLYYKFFKFLGIKKKIPKISFFMPYKRLWKYYRNMGKKKEWNNK